MYNDLRSRITHIIDENPIENERAKRQEVSRSDEGSDKERKKRASAALVLSNGGRNTRTSPEESSRRDKSSHALRSITLVPRTTSYGEQSSLVGASWLLLRMSHSVGKWTSRNVWHAEKRNERLQDEFRLGENVMFPRKVNKNFLSNKFYCYCFILLFAEI